MALNIIMCAVLALVSVAVTVAIMISLAAIPVG